MTKDYFLKTSTSPHFKDVETLKRFLTNRGKIKPRETTGLTALTQRKLTQQIKYARYLGLIPYTSYQSEHLTKPS